MGLRQFLYSRWFFLLLAIVCLTDLSADLGEHFWGWTTLNFVSIAMDVVASVLAVWIFFDLQRRRPGNERRTGR